MGRKVSSKCSQRRLDHATDAFKTTTKRAIQKTAESTGDLNGKKILDIITRSSKISPQNNSETNEEILREKYIYQKSIGDLRLMEK